MYKVLDQQQLDASIQAFVSKKFDKFRDLKLTKGRAQHGVKSSLASSEQNMWDCQEDGYIWTSATAH